jgi:DNA-binding response OmpR family regulator
MSVSSEAPDESKRPGAAHHGKRLLYIDDDRFVAFLVTRELSRRNHSAQAATSAEMGVALFRENPADFDIVIADYNMPVMSGLRVAEEVLRVAPATPVLIASGLVTEALRAEALQIGVRAVINKPGTIEELCDAIMGARAELGLR